MKLFAAFIFFTALVRAQTCAPADILRPVDSVQGTLGDGNCRLSNGAPYAEYSLVLPTRGLLALSGTLALILRDDSGHKIDSGTAIQRPVERGAYTVVVSGDPGDFKLYSHFAPEPGTLCRDFPRIGLNQTVSGTWGDASCRLPDGSLYSAYTVYSFSSGTLDISLDTGAILVRSDDGHLLATDQSKVSVPVRGDSSYTILAASAASGSFTLAVSFTIADDETCRPQQAFTDTAQAAAKITPDCTLTPLDSDTALPFHYYDVKVSDAGAADIQLSSPAFAPMLYLLDSSGNLIQADLQSGGQGTAIVHQQLKPGNYTIVAFSAQAKGGGDYTLQYTFRPGLPETCPVLSLDPGNEVPGSLSGASCRTREGIADVYRIVLPAAGTLGIGMTTQDFDAALVLRDDKDNALVSGNASAGDISHAVITADLPAGTYSLVATTQNLPGGYTIQYQVTPHDLAACATFQKMDVNTGYIGVLGNDSCRAANGEPRDYYEFTTPAGGTVAVVMTSIYLDSFLTLEDTQANILRWDDNSYGLGNALAVQYLPAGTYRIGARAAESVFTGYYRVDVLFTAGDRPAMCAPLRTVSPGDVVTATLGYTSCQYVDDTFADIYQVNLTDPTQLKIGLDSTQFDAYLLLLDLQGNVIDEDDNGGGGTSAYIAHQLDPGTYYVVAKPVTGYSSVGSYTLGIGTVQ